ncbi:hypothetical protein DAPPUDRAFT_316665 [Daphnia pulex]|uniref:BTB domain-containing protein n=1 Tax=Daphnia pulex TaxID=6669 RepID=E9GDM3_DAPPU|nr:hypothetical protein DAPPUDRAFT_316665 [Daphnia pulex]|eukprot:EFX82452.1 hypothetical protein DAPPUDRAFT_316665 [Daphnia pulex]
MHPLGLGVKQPELALRSPDFYSNGIFWSLRLYLKEDPKSDVGVFLQSYCDSRNSQTRKLEIAVKFTMYVVTTATDNICHSSGQELQTLDSTFILGHKMGCFSISQEKLMSRPFLYIPDNVLTIGCELNWAFQSQNMGTLPSPKNPFPLKPNSLDKFFNNPKFNDVKISTGGKVFHATKWVLCDASDVFEQLIFSESPDGRNTINIEDINPVAFEGVLRYIFSKVLPDLHIEEHAEDWFKITHKFELHALQNVLQKGFFLQLKPSNAIMCLKTADRYSVADLRPKCKQYLRENWNEVAANHGLEKFTICHATATVEDYAELLKSFALVNEITESFPGRIKSRLFKARKSKPDSDSFIAFFIKPIVLEFFYL